jgi:hypothetical protein
MRIEEAHARMREPVQVWRRNLACRIVGFDIAITHVIGQDENEVRATGRTRNLLVGLCAGKDQCACRGEENRK